MSDLALLILTNGEEIIGEIKGETDRGVDLDDVLVISYYNDHNESPIPVVYFRKYCIHTPSFSVFFKKEHIVNIFRDINQDIVDYYAKSLQKYKDYVDVEKNLYENEYNREYGFDDDFDPDDSDDGFDNVIRFPTSNTTIH